LPLITTELEIIYNQGVTPFGTQVRRLQSVATRSPHSAGKETIRMGVSSGQSHAAEMAFLVYQRALHPEWLATRSFRRLNHAAWEADLRLTDKGHAVMFRCGSVRLAEILTSDETTLPEPGRVYQSDLRRERSTRLSHGGIVEYQSCVEVERVDPEIFRYLCNEITLDVSRNRIFHRLPSGNRMAPAPLAQIHFDVRGRGLSVQSLHTFPDECAILRTQSLFELVQAPSKR
jgi:hypothetical protein